MTERDILLAFAERYPRSAMRTGGRPLRLRDWEKRDPSITRSAESLTTFLETMEALERQGLLRLGWWGRKKGERLAWAELVDPERLFQRLDRSTPDDLALGLRNSAKRLVRQTEGRNDRVSPDFFRIVVEHSNSLIDLVDSSDLDDLATLLSQEPAFFSGVPIRSLSIRLFGDSKRLERLLPVAQKIARLGHRLDLISELPSRSYPEVWIGGALECTPVDGSPWRIQKGPQGLSLALVRQLRSLRPIGGTSGKILSVENKETFYALCDSALPFDAYVYCGGRPNRAVRQTLTLLHREGYRIYHAGDLDADGIAILGELGRLVNAQPFGMNVQTFDRYLPYARTLDAPLLRRLAQIPEDTRQMGGIGPLMERIAATGKGVEQEIIDYSQEPVD